MPRILRTFGFWSWAATLAWSMRARASSSLPEIAGLRRTMVTIFSRPDGPELGCPYSGPTPVASVSSRSTSFPNFSFLGIVLS